MQIELQGQEQLFNTLSALERQIVYKDAKNGLKKAGMQIIADAQRNLRNSHINTTGRLSNSGKVQETADGQGLDVGFMSGDENYAGAVEYGRRAGKMPPPRMLAAWAYKKFQLKDWKEANSAGFAIARLIARFGTKPHPFFKPAVEKNESRILREITEAIKRTINRNGV